MWDPGEGWDDGAFEVYHCLTTLFKSSLQHGYLAGIMGLVVFVGSCILILWGRSLQRKSIGVRKGVHTS